MMLWSFLDLMFSILSKFSLFIFALAFLYISATWKMQLVNFFFVLYHQPQFIFSILSSKEVINYDNVRVTYNQLVTLQQYHKEPVDIYVVNAFCRKLFQDKHPKDSGWHYLFSTVGVSLTFFLIFYVSDKLPNHLFWIFVYINFFEPHFVCVPWKGLSHGSTSKSKG
jgi:hypothetical protein